MYTQLDQVSSEQQGKRTTFFSVEHVPMAPLHDGGAVLQQDLLQNLLVLVDCITLCVHYETNQP